MRDIKTQVLEISEIVRRDTLEEVGQATTTVKLTCFTTWQCDICVAVSLQRPSKVPVSQYHISMSWMTETVIAL